MAYTKVKLNHISLKALEVGHSYNYPIFYKSRDDIFKKLIELDGSYNDEIGQKIINYNIKDVYVLAKDHPQYEIDTQEYLTKLIYDKTISAQLKSEIIHEMASDTMNELFQGALTTKKIERTSELVTDTINLILNDKVAVKAMMGVTSYDYYTYTHCVNVAIYSLGFASYLKLSKEELYRIGMAAMLHDLGKKDVPNEIVNKNGRLSDEEFELMKNHPTYGVKILKKISSLEQEILDIIEQHHEKLDGTGYPYGLTAEKITYLSQIVAICDIFDALTTKRSYKDALNSYRAFIIMEKEMAKELNIELLKKFIIFMSEKIEQDKNN